MSTTKTLLAIGAIALGTTTLVGVSLADGKRGHRGDHHGGPRAERMFEQFDANGDGTITQAEIDQVRQDRLAAFDTDNDGNLTLEEYEVLWLDAMRARMVDRFQRLDEDGDAIVTIEEFVEPFDSTVARLDRNDDGEITRNELRRGRHHDRRRGGDDDDSRDG